MIKFINACLVLTALVSAFFLYSLEHTTRETERQIAKLENGISEEREATKLLNAEWSSLSRPDRLQHFAEDNLKLVPEKANQTVSLAELATRVPDAPVVKVDEKSADPIGDILKEMAQ
jgi:cell division protein FtsL